MRPGPLTPKLPADFLVFEIAGRLCAFGAGDVRDIVFLAALSHSPGQPSVLEGLLNLRGRAVPVIRLDRLFDLPRMEGRLHTPLILLNGGSQPFAVMADRVLEIANVPPAGLRPLAEADSFNGCAEAQFTLDGRDVSVLAAGRLLLEKETQCVAALQSTTQRYLDELRERTA